MMDFSRLSLSTLTALCLTGAAWGADTSTQAVPKKPSSSALEEVVVTAERHKSTVQNTPISMTALSGAQLKQRGLTTVEDIVKEVPGLSVRSAGPGQTEYEARGLSSTGGAAPTVGFYLNDVPMSPPAAAQTGKVVIDPDLYDISSVEVLRGPQGTLYGSGSMGGTVRVVTNQPKLGVFEGTVDATASGTEGGGANGGFNAMLNIPLSDTLAIRLVGSDIARSGWIDRIVLSPFPDSPATSSRAGLAQAPVQSQKNNVNSEEQATFRGGVLFKPNETTSITGDVLYQNTKLGGYDEFDMPPGSTGKLAHYEVFPVSEPFHDIVKIISLAAVEDFGFASLTSDTAFWERNEKQTQDATENIGNSGFYSTYVPLPYSELDYTRQFSEEIRLASPETDSRLRWVVGAFYTDLRSLWIEHGANADATEITSQGQPDGLIFQSYNPYQIKQIALFGDGSINITDELKFSAGARFNRYESTLEINEWGLAFPGVLLKPAVGTNVSGAANAVTPRFNLSYSPTKDLNTYITASQGYRPGGLNQAVPAYCGGAPSSYASDSVWNYEIGEKARLFNGKLTINSDFYYDRWTNIQQLLLLNCGYEYYDNAGNGHSYGPELEVAAKVTPEITISGSGAYTNAEITSPNPILASAVIAYAQPGTISSCSSVSHCTLPILNVPKYTASISAVYTRPVLDKYVFTARITDNYVGPVVDESFYPIINLPTYDLVNVRLSISGDKWTATLFGNNLTNRHAQISANNTSFQFNTAAYYRVSTNQPLTAGVDVSYRF